jgi:hypothetical protein
MDNIKNDKTEGGEIKEKISKTVKKDIEKLLRDKEGGTPSESLGNKWKETLSDKDATSKGSGSRSSLENRMSTIDPKTLERKREALEKSRKQPLNGKDEVKNKSSRTSLEDRMSIVNPKRIEKERESEKFQRKLSKINRQSIERIKKNVKERSRKVAERKKTAFKKKLKEKMKKKVTMKAKEGKSITISLLFTIFLFVALLNDSVDIVVGIVSWVVTLTGVGVVILAITEILGDIIDVVTTILLGAFSFYVGGTTKAGAKKIIKRVALYAGAFIIELVPLLNLFAAWSFVLLYDWYKVRKRATEAEKMDE